MPDLQLPADLVREVEADAQAFYRAKIQEVAKFYTDPGVVVWKPDEVEPTIPQEGWPKDGAGKYHGDVAEGYDAKREQQPKWVWEQSVITDMLSDLPKGSWILDCPVGTGRFLPFYIERGYHCHAVDISADMLQLAGAKANKCEAPEPVHMNFTQASILELTMPARWVDAAVMCRLTRWLSIEECQTAMRVLQRVARKKIIFTTRVKHRRPELARPMNVYEAALEGWRVSRNESMPNDPDYRVVMLEKT